MSGATGLEQKIKKLTHNLWWTWHPEAIDVWRNIDPALWRETRHSPIAFVRQLSKDRVEALNEDPSFRIKIHRVLSDLQRYRDSSATWGGIHARQLRTRPVAYFCAEFGIHESLPLYSGGLGVLAGDHLKSASDLGIPMVGVSLFYRNGYFRQRISEEGEQIADDEEVNPEDLPLVRVQDAQGRPVVIDLPIQGDTVQISAWTVPLGRIRLYFLDMEEAFRALGFQDLGSRLYGGDEAVRLSQEMILGIGGMRLLLRLGISPGVIHLNEGHSAFAPLEYARHLMTEHGLSFEQARMQSRSRTVFTTHTPVVAGHDRFSSDLMGKITWKYRESLGVTHEQLMDLGRVHPGDDQETFCMTVLALKTASRSNGVSFIHGQVSRQMWNQLWPDSPPQHVPIGHITNGINVLGWLAPPMRRLFDQYFTPDWKQRIGKEEVWQQIHAIPDEELWNTAMLLKARLLAFLPRLPHRAHPEGIKLDPRVLTIGFARRFAGYKRATLLLDDPERFAKLLSNPARPVQIIFSGKAHPRDQIGQEMVKKVYRSLTDPRFAGKLVFIEDYDVNVARHLVQGVDLWLNTPRQAFEASGTSGMKVALNGGLNLSILDGWWPEGYDGNNGFGVRGSRNENDQVRDGHDREALYETLEQEVIPLYYKQDTEGVPGGWVHRMKEAMCTLGWRFSSDRMVIDYAMHCYLPAGGISTCQMDAPFV